MTTQGENTCARCYWWDERRADGYEVQLNDGTVLDERKAPCRAKSPPWPMTRPTDWCGDWKAKATRTACDACAAEVAGRCVRHVMGPTL